jgi:hypothetical protein
VRYRLAAETDDEGSDEDNRSSGRGKVQRKRKAVGSAGKEPKSKRAKVDKDE